MINNQCQISRLKGYFRNQINYPDYNILINSAKRKVSGKLPRDIRVLAVKNKNNKHQAVLGIENAFIQCANMLGEINKFRYQCINRTTRTLSRLIRLTKNLSWRERLITDKLYLEKETESIIRAEMALLENIKPYIPEAKNVIISILGDGIYGTSYKCNVFDKKGAKIFSDKVMKIFYKNNEQNKILYDKEKRYVDLCSDEQLDKYIELRKKAAKYNGYSADFPYKTAQEFREHMESKYKDFMNYTSKEYMMQHSAAAEANVSEYIRFHSGHKLVSTKDGIRIPDFFYLGDTEFSLGEFIENNAKAVKPFDFHKLGLKHTDYDKNKGNNINSICVDLGGIIKLSPNP